MGHLTYDIVAFLASDSSKSGFVFTSVTGAGLTWTLRSRANSQPGTAEIWQAVAPAALVNVSVTANRGTAVTVVAFSGANITANGAVASGSSAASAPTWRSSKCAGADRLET